MKHVIISMLMAGTILAGGQALARDLPVTRVVLSTSGLAHFEHEAKVTGSETLDMSVRMDQVDDLLKSLVVFDPQGRIGGVTLPGRAPLEQIFRDLPFTQDELKSPVALLNAYQGAEVAVNAGGPLLGRLVQVSPEILVLPDGQGTVERHRVSLMTADGLKQAMLEDLKSIAFTDARVRGEIERALVAVRDNGTLDRRTLSVSVKGEGSREVTLGYVVEAPLWKSAYRLALPEKDGDKGLIQGWAVIENMTGNDWKDVDITLVSGNPVTYRQALYQSYHVDRPSIPVEVFGRVMPRVDSGVVATARDMEGAAAEAMPEPREGKMKSAPMRAETMAMMANNAVSSEGFAGAAMPGMPPQPASADELVNFRRRTGMAEGANAAQSAEATTQVLFRFPDKFSVGAGETMLLPFVSRNASMEKLDLYQPETNATHPLAAVRIKNDGPSGLPPGILTIYEANKDVGGMTFVGDAQFPVLAKGEDRLIGYALDSKTTVDRIDHNLQTEGTTTLARGIMKTSIKYRTETEYTIKAPEGEDRTVMIEQPRMGGYEIKEPDPKSVEVTATHYRIKTPVKAGKTQKLKVVLEQDSWQQYEIQYLSSADFQGYASTRGNLTDKQRKVFEKLAGLRAVVDEIDLKIQQAENERQQIYNDQQRLRQNIESLDGKSDIKERYMDKLNEQEDSLEKIAKARAKLDAERAERWQEMQDYILTIEM